MQVDPPNLIAALPEAEPQDATAGVRRLCGLHDVPLETRHRAGRPVRCIAEEAEQHELVVVVRRQGRGDPWGDPDLAMRIVRAVPCSVLVLTLAAEG